MATAAHAIERISEATGILHATVFRIARHLREAEGKDLWPLGVTGAPSRGREVIVYPNHLINLLLGLSVTPITTSASVVAWMRELVPATAIGFENFLPGDTLAEALENLVDEGSNSAKPITIAIGRYGTRMPTVRLFSHAAGRGRESFFIASKQNSEAAFESIPEGAPFVTFELRQPLIDVTTHLWADTKKHLATITRPS